MNARVLNPKAWNMHLHVFTSLFIGSGLLNAHCRGRYEPSFKVYTYIISQQPTTAVFLKNKQPWPARPNTTAMHLWSLPFQLPHRQHCETHQVRWQSCNSSLLMSQITRFDQIGKLCSCHNFIYTIRPEYTNRYGVLFVSECVCVCMCVFQLCLILFLWASELSPFSQWRQGYTSPWTGKAISTHQ